MKNIKEKIEALLFVSGKPIEIKDIAEKLEIPDKKVLEYVKELQNYYSGDCGIHLLVFNKKVQFSSNPAYSNFIESVLNPIKERELSKTMMEVAAIIAYKQPITKSEIEEIRGVNSDYAIGILSGNSIIEVVGRKDAVGKPLLFGTTDEFLKRFQISSIDDLPDYEQLLERIKILQPERTDLYHKDTYIPTDEELKSEEKRKLKQLEINNLQTNAEELIKPKDKKSKKSAGVETLKTGAEEIPDFLKDEKNLQKF